MVSICDLPKEILLQIFEFYLATENQKKFMKIIFQVCCNWRDLCFETFLWKTYDGSPNFIIMMELCKRECFRNTTHFKFSYIDCLDDKDVIELLMQLKNVKIIDFSNLKHFTSNILLELSNNCLNLQKIQFGQIRDYSKVKKKLTYSDLLPFFSLRGFNLLSIDLSYCIIINLSRIIICIADCCPNLEHFMLNSVHSVQITFPTDYFQRKCPKLKSLCLDFQINLSSKRYINGFPNLEVFTFYDPYGRAMYDKELNNILFNSSSLKVLDLNYCRISIDILCSLPATDLQVLNISKTKANESENLNKVMRKWSHSLKEVNVSYCAKDSINEAILDLITLPVSPQVENLNLSNTRIKAHVVDKVLKKCKKLKTLNIESCRNLGRGMKRVYVGKNELQVLEEKVKLFINIEINDSTT